MKATMKLSHGSLLFVALAFGFAPVDLANAQMDRSGLSVSPQSGTANFRFAEPNELTIVVSIMGAVRNPGRYELSRSINLLDLIALSGGWLDSGDPTDISVTRVQAGPSGLDRKEFRISLEDISRVRENQLVLQQGDIIFIPSTSSVTFDDVLRWVTAIGVIVTTGIALANN